MEDSRITKQEALRMVRQAKSAHIRWRAYVQAMLAGLDIETERVPISHKECDFGQWFYREGFKAFGHWQVFQDVEYSHELLHDVYRRIHSALSSGDQARADHAAVQLVGISHSLLETIDLLREEIESSHHEHF